MVSVPSMVEVTTVTPVVTGTSEQALSEHEVTVTTVVEAFDSIAVEVEAAPEEVTAPEEAPEVAAEEAADEAADEALEAAEEAADEALEAAEEAADEAAEEAAEEALEAADEALEAAEEADDEARDEIDEASSLMVFDNENDLVALLINFLPSGVVMVKSTSDEYGAPAVA